VEGKLVAKHTQKEQRTASKKNISPIAKRTPAQQKEMNAAGQLAVREDAALNAIKAKLGIPTNSGSGSNNNGANPNGSTSTTATGGGPSATSGISGGGGMSPQLQSIVDVFLLRFMRNKKLNIDETMEKLRRRREFEGSLSGISVTPGCVKALRSGAFHLLGVDVMRRPVLYVRLHIFRSVTEADEMEKLAIVLLEYVQAVAMHSSSQQEIVLLVAQQDSTWYHAQGMGSTQSELLIALLSKYYPDLVGLVLIVDAPWATRQRVKTALASTATSSRARNLLQIVSKSDLQRFVDVTILPEDLGGRHALGSPHDFSEAVLRHWYATVSLVQQENAGSSSNGSRPLYIPTSAVVGNGAASTSSFRGGGGASRGPSSLMRTNISGLTPRRARGFGASQHNAGGADAATDDGMCSVISDTDVEVLDDEDGGTDTELSASAAAAGAATGRSGPAGNDQGVSSPSNKGQLQQELREERDRRIALEHELTRLRLGMTIDPATATHLETALKHIHDELNVVIGEVITRSKATSATTSGTKRQGGGGGGGPSLHQLIELTDSQVLKVVQERQQVAAMKFATPPEDRSRSRGGCTLM
jgi:hypothetical protein